MILTALLARLGWRRHRTAGDARSRLRSILEREKAELTAAATPPPRKPTREEMIEQGDLKIIPNQVEKALPRPAPATFHLPTVGHRIAGLAYNAEGVLHAMVQLLPGDAFWLNEKTFPPYEWRTVRMAGEPVRVQRMGGDLCIENPQQGDRSGCWLPLKLG